MYKYSGRLPAEGIRSRVEGNHKKIEFGIVQSEWDNGKRIGRGSKRMMVNRERRSKGQQIGKTGHETNQNC